ncbi:MAG: hypothetical protein J6K76_08225 [Spirochaetaceae bacterium]|nr:hypothetical protein [Spirochaetaceae bacterium]
MNTIPSIFNEYQVPLTILNGNETISNPRLPIAVILLNIGSGGLYRNKILENLVKSGFSSIVSIDKNLGNYNVEEMLRNYPSVKFIIPRDTVSVGDMINIGMGEITEDYALVINDSIHVTSTLLSANVIERYIIQDYFCIAPKLVDYQRRPLPVRFTPAIEHYNLKPQFSDVISDKSTTLYPFDFVGIYNREKFIRFGGYDYTITSPYWQNLDFSLRAWLWGEEIIMTPLFQLAYEGEIPVPDTTPDHTQLRFYLKNGAPRYVENRCYIPISQFINYSRRAKLPLGLAYKEFMEARRWVAKNKYAFQQDLNMLIDKWGEKN